jgi:hypothetical protein
MGKNIVALKRESVAFSYETKNAPLGSHCGGKEVCRLSRPTAGGESRKRDSILLENFVSPTNGKKSIAFTQQNKLEHIILNLEVYGAVGVYHLGTLSDLVIDGTSYRFE